MTVDVRTRVDRERPRADPAELLDVELPAAIDAAAHLVEPALSFLRLRPVTIDVDGGTWTFTRTDDFVTVRRGALDGSARVRLDVGQLDDLARDQQTFMSMWAANRLDVRDGTVGDLLDWWLVIRAALDTTPIYTPGSVDFRDEHGAPLDLTRSFRADDDPDEMRTFVEQAGFLHLTEVFTADEMAEVSRDMDRAAPSYSEGDGRSWWARTGDGTTRLVRMQGFDRESPAAAALLEDPRFLDVATIPGAGHGRGPKRAHNRIEALFKPIGVVEGISDIAWHKDCGLGRHSYDCCGLTVGISVTGAGDDSGQLHALAGSHRALIWSGVRQPRLDLPDVPLPTRTGDITLHLSCTMHMAQPPTVTERRVMYSGFALPPLAETDLDAVASARARIGAVRETAPLTVLDRHFKS